MEKDISKVDPLSKNDVTQKEMNTNVRDEINMPSLDQFMHLIAEEDTTLNTARSAYNVYNKYNKGT